MRINLSELQQLREIHRISTLETAMFKGRSEMELWMATWISNPLKEIIKVIEDRG